MRTFKTLAALLTVFGAAVAHASGDSVSMNSTYCRVMAQEGDNIYKVIYQASQKEDVSIAFKNTNNELVHVENVRSTDGFAKRFDLGSLPEGDYEVEVSSGDYSYKESVKIGDVSAYNFIVKDLKDRKIALIGSQPANKELTLIILDSNSEEVYKESLSDTPEIKKQFQFGPYVGKEVTFLLYAESKLVKYETVTF